MLRFLARSLGLVIGGMLATTTVQAQEVPQVITPLRVETDHNGVNLVDGKTKMDIPVLTVPGAGHLMFDRAQNAAPFVSGKIPSNGFDSPRVANYSVHFGGENSEGFQCLDFDCSSLTGTGSTFRENANTYQQAGTGTVYHFTNRHVKTNSTPISLLYYVSTVDYRGGETLSYTYDTAVLPGDTFNRLFYRTNRIDSTLGFFITLTYQPGDLGTEGWNSVAQATIYNSADPTTPLAQLTYSGNTITDLAGRVFTCNDCSNELGSDIEVTNGSIQLPGEASPALQAFPHPSLPLVTSVVKDGVTWTYTYANPRFDGQSLGYLYDSVTVNGPNGFHNVYNMIVQDHRNVISRLTDSIGRVSTFSFDGTYRPTRIVSPELNEVDVAYDSFGNIVSKTTKAKPGTGQPDITETAVYPTATCVGVLCYRPQSVQDGLGRQTDFVYNSAGQITEQKDPADANGVRRETYTTYETGTISRKSVVRVCGDITTCGTANEIRTEYEYFGSTFLPSVERRIDAAAGVTLTTTYSYDNAGRLLSEDGPLPGTDDAKYFRYDILGRKTWEIGAKGANGLRSAKRFTYRDSDDKVVATETGTVTDPTSTILTVLSRGDVIYDGRRNPVRTAVSASGTIFGLVERSFDDRGQLLCEARRMNPATFGAAVDGCALGAEGTQGPDRITHNMYDAAGQLQTVQKAYLTSLQQDYVRYEYTPNGKQKAVTDANGNRAEMTYDAYDRQLRWIFPSPSGGGVANQGDYEEYGYDAVGNRMSLRKRDGVTIAYQYDGMNRMTLKNVPASASGAAGYSVFYGYDVRGLQTFARFGSAAGAGITNAYDGFGRLTSSTNTMGGFSRTLSHQYDADGNRTRIDHPDGAFFTYEYDAANQPTLLREVGSAVLASFTYDAAGRRSGLGFAGASTSYGYDAVDRLTSLTHDLGGTSADQGLTFGYNPASQIVTRTSSNDAYASNTAYDVSRGYAVNGLNQYVFAGPNAYQYDGNGNLTFDGSTNFVYDAENRLVSAAGKANANLVYDPVGRLFQTSGGSAGVTQFLYDGDALVGEYDSGGTMVRRYAHGTDAGADDPLIWYEYPVAGYRRGLITDHQGSVIAVTDMSGNPVAINAYDPWGIPNTSASPGTTIAGRFGYTGQAWIPELGMYYYKARIYSPSLGRFMQTDPVGYKDQVNLYAYVGNDSVNGRDPDGKEICGGTPAQCAAYRAALAYAEKSANNPALTPSERNEIRTEVNNIRADKSYVILFLSKDQIDKITRYTGFAFTDMTKNGTIYTALPDDFGDLYEKYPNTNPIAERAGVVIHEGSHRGDFHHGTIKRGEPFSRNSPTEKKADRRQDLTVKAGQNGCTGTRLCNN